jgi:molybdopterin-guanine dinucleotide biosynthesis protein A
MSELLPSSSAVVVILAGGLGRRMGGNKPFYPYSDTHLIGRVIDRLKPQAEDIQINVGAIDGPLVNRLSNLGHRIIADPPGYAHLGPMSGVFAALKLAADLGHRHVITVPCDMPDLAPDTVCRLRDAGAGDDDVVHFKGLRSYPLCALWRTRMLPHLSKALEASKLEGGLGVMRFLSGLKVCHIDIDDERGFLNVNRPEDLAAPQPNERNQVAW